MQWDSNLYLKFKNERTRPSSDLIAGIGSIAPKSIIDIGCGPGNSTEKLMKRFPNAEITGVDSSPAMISAAKEAYGGTAIKFMLADISEDSIKEKYDLVFSNACLQWVPDHKKLIPKLMSMLNEGGVLAVQVPEPYNVIKDILREITAMDKWAGYFDGVERINILSAEEYHDILSECSSEFTIWETVYHHRMKSHKDIIEWYKGTGLKPYLDALSDVIKAELESEILARLEKSCPIRKNGEVIFKFPRLFFTAAL